MSPIFIIGMHRSGTSCLAGCLEDAGLVLGAVNRAARHNQKGNNENKQLRVMHDTMLARVGAAWDAPPVGIVEWTAADTAAARALIQQYPQDQVWGLKDPRTLLLLEGWMAMLPNLRFAGTFRHPLDVAASLHARNGLPEERCLTLWLAYNQRLLAWRRRHLFPIVRYGADGGDYLARVRTLAAELGLKANADIKFREEALTHHSSDAPLTGAIGAVWDELLSLQTR